MSIYLEPQKKLKSTDNEWSKVPENIDLDYICVYLRRVGLKIDDVGIKLGLNKIIHFLHSLSSSQKSEASQFHQLSREQIYSPPKSQFIDQSEKENNQSLCEPESFVIIQTSKSLLTQKEQNIPFLRGLSKGEGLRFSSSFKVKQVVTKNSLDEPQTRKQKVKFNSDINSAFQMEDSFQKIEKMEGENEKIKKCLQNILLFFQDQKIIKYNTILNLQNQEFSSFVQQVTSNYLLNKKQWEEKINNLSVKSQLLQQTVQNLSISLRINKQTKKVEQNSMSHETQTDNNHSQPLVSQEQLKVKLQQTQQALQKLQLLSFIKDEEIFSLKVMVSDLQNRLKAASVPTDQKIRSKSYKKYFNITGENLASTVR